MNKKQFGKKSFPRNVLFSLLKIGISIYVVLALLLFVFQKQLLFFPTTEIRVTPASNNWDFQEFILPIGAFETFGWFIPAQTETSIQPTPDVASDLAKQFIRGAVSVDNRLISVVDLDDVLPVAKDEAA